MDMSKYQELFVSECREHLRSMGEMIVLLEKEGSDQERINSLFRSAHSIKGMAASMGYSGMAELAHRAEDLMGRVRKGEIAFAPGVADLLLEAADRLEAMILDLTQGGGGSSDVAELMERIAGYDGTLAANAAPAPVPAQTPAEPPLPVRRKADLRSKRDGAGQSVRVKTEILDHLINTTGELITNKNRLVDVAGGVGSARLDEAVGELSRLLRDLYNRVVAVRMMPFSTISERFPRVVRDLAKKSGKEVTFAIEGDEIELDRGILEELADPLIHIIRNAIDHGLETAAERLDRGKGAGGLISISVARERDQVVITVADDGRGMDAGQLTARAVEKGFISAEKGKALSAREALLLVCTPGFSTALEVTEVSGRGVGMDSVNSTVRSLSGSLAIESEPGRGSSFTLKLPLTTTIINALLAKVSSFSVAVPVTNILQTMELRPSAISTADGQQVFYLGDEAIPLLALRRIFAIAEEPTEAEFVPLFIVESLGRRVGLAVDRFVGQQQVFVKPLGRPLEKMKGLAGGAILGDGEVVFILDLASLI